MRTYNTYWFSNTKWSILKTYTYMSIIKTEQFVFIHLDICMYFIHIYASTKEKEAMNLNSSKGTYMGRLQGREGRVEMMKLEPSALYVLRLWGCN